MNAHTTVLIFWCLSVASSGVTADLSGIYVNKQSLSDRVEFLIEGRYFRSYPQGQGQYTKEGEAIVCREEGTEEFRFQRKGKTLIDQDGCEWVPREEVASMPWKGVSPVTMVVLDHKTREPIRKFTYTYTISTAEAEYDPLLVRPTPVESEDGTFLLMAPKSCEIGLRIEGGPVLGGYGSWKSCTLTADNIMRRLEVLVETGSTVKGVVVDARTGNPIEGALVSPVVFTPPLFSPDRDRAVTTDAKGEFSVQGVDGNLGINVWHPDFFEGGYSRDRWGLTEEPAKEENGPVRIELKSGEKLFGVVRDPSGKPVADVEVSDGAGKGVRTGSDGSFVLQSPRKWSEDKTYQLSFEKDGYLDQELHPKSADPKGFAVVLEPQPVLRGQVLDPNGDPVTNYIVSAGATLEPEDWQCSSEKVIDPRGWFSLPVSTDRDYDETGKVWVGVKTLEFASWETHVDIWQGTKSITVHLKPGIAVHGTVTNRRDHSGSISAELFPCRINKEQYTLEHSQRQALGRMRTTVDESGKFRFDHVGPGPYLLAISGPTVSPVSTGFSVSDSNLDAGSFSLQGTGSVYGMVYEPRRICEGDTCRLDEKRGGWAFADGEIYFADNSGRNERDFAHLRPIPFKTDERGHFRVDGVPVGMASVCFPYNITADIIGSHVRNAVVVEGKATEVRFFDTSEDWQVVCEIVVGDGSPAQFATGSGMVADRKVKYVTTRPPMFNIELKPADGVPASFCDADREEIDENKRILLRDVQPGKYRMVVSDGQGSMGSQATLFEEDVETKLGGTALTVPLGAGCITGAVRWSKENRYVIHVIAVGEKTGTIRHACCDSEGDFCTRYLPEDDYGLVAHDYDAGWCEMVSTSVKSDVTDIGIHQLRPGGTITGKMPPRLAYDPSAKVEAIDSRGVSIENPNYYEPVGDVFTIANLWPGRWRIKVTKGQSVLAEQTVVLTGTETVSCDLGLE